MKPGLTANARDLFEFENVEVSPGGVTIIPLRISHSVISIPTKDENFLRLKFYSKVRWRVPIATCNEKGKALRRACRG